MSISLFVSLFHDIYVYEYVIFMCIYTVLRACLLCIMFHIVIAINVGCLYIPVALESFLGDGMGLVELGSVLLI